MSPENTPLPHTPDDEAASRTLLRWAIGPPDEDLLRRYFAAQAGLGPLLETLLTEAQRQHVVASLNANPEWQALWRQLEQEYGLSVEWPRAHVPGEMPRQARLWTLPPARLAAAAVFVLLALYSILWAAGRMNLPETYTLASLESHHAHLEQQLRSDSADTSGAFEQGLQALLDAPTSIAGLFPNYNQTKVRDAVTQLTDALDRASTDFQRGEIAFLLAKAALMQGNTLEARRQLDYLTSLDLDWRGEYYSDDVETLLEKLPQGP